MVPKFSLFPRLIPLYIVYTVFLLQEFPIPGTDSSVAILFIDTVQLAGITHPPLRSIPPAGPASIPIADEQWTFINKTLALWAGDGAANRWRMVVGHYPGKGWCRVQSAGYILALKDN